MKTIGELSKGGSDIYTGLIEDSLRRKGYKISRRSLEYYLKDLNGQGFISLSKVRKGRGYSQRIVLLIKPELVLQ